MPHAFDVPELLLLLDQATFSDRLEWAETAEEGVYRAGLTSGTVLLGCSNRPEPDGWPERYHVRVLNARNEVLAIATATDEEPWFYTTRRLHDAVVAKLSGKVRVLDGDGLDDVVGELRRRAEGWVE